MESKMQEEPNAKRQKIEQPPVAPVPLSQADPWHLIIMARLSVIEAQVQKAGQIITSPLQAIQHYDSLAAQKILVLDEYVARARRVVGDMSENTLTLFGARVTYLEGLLRGAPTSSLFGIPSIPQQLEQLTTVVSQSLFWTFGAVFAGGPPIINRIARLEQLMQWFREVDEMRRGRVRIALHPPVPEPLPAPDRLPVPAPTIFRQGGSLFGGGDGRMFFDVRQ